MQQQHTKLVKDAGDAVASSEVEGEPLPFAQELERTTSKFRDYLLFGHKKEGLDYAMKHGLWGHALFLASKMDERTYSSVMLRYAFSLLLSVIDVGIYIYFVIFLLFSVCEVKD